MTRNLVPRTHLLVASLLLLAAMAGCLQITEGPDERVESGSPSGTSDAGGDAVDEGAGETEDDDGTEGDGEDEGTDASGEDEEASDGSPSDGSTANDGAASVDGDGGADDGSDVAPPGSIDDRPVERAVWRRIDAHRDTVGVRDAEWSQGLGVEPGRAANEELVERDATPPTLATGEAFASSSEELLERFREEGVSSCTGLSKDVAGQVSAVIDIRPHSDAANPRDAATTAERVAHHVIREWRDDPETADVIQGSYRYVGVDALYDADTGTLYLTAPFC